MTYALHLPTIHGQAIAGQTLPCGMSPQAHDFALAWMALLGDTAEPMYCDARLTEAAQSQAEFLAHNDFVPGDPHRGYLGSTANDRVMAAGYKLPWGSGNQVESAVRSWNDAQTAARVLANHETHIPHMQRRGWFSEHVVWGVGFAEALIDGGGNFWVVCSAPVEGN